MGKNKANRAEIAQARWLENEERIQYLTPLILQIVLLSPDKIWTAETLRKELNQELSRRKARLVGENDAQYKFALYRCLQNSKLQSFIDESASKGEGRLRFGYSDQPLFPSQATR